LQGRLQDSKDDQSQANPAGRCGHHGRELNAQRHGIKAKNFHFHSTRARLESKEAKPYNKIESNSAAATQQRA